MRGLATVTRGGEFAALVGATRWVALRGGIPDASGGQANTHRSCPKEIGAGRSVTYDPLVHHRRSVRVKGYDYTQAGAYFITLCLEGRQCLFGDIIDEGMKLNVLGEIVEAEWVRTATVRPDVELDAFVVMPNHVHGIIVLTNDTRDEEGRGRATHRVAPTNASRLQGPATGSIGAIIGQFKSLTAKSINRQRCTPGAPIWQQNYYERVIRNERELEAAREYVVYNPSRWLLDEENSAVGSGHVPNLARREQP